MRILPAILLMSALPCARDPVLDTERPKAKAARMDAAILANIPIRMKEFVPAQTTAGVVTLVARRGAVARFEAVGYQDLENKVPMRKDTMFRIASRAL